MSIPSGDVSSLELSVVRVGGSVWIIRLLEALGPAAVSHLRAAFDEAVANGAADIVVELAPTEETSTQGAAALGEMADVMRARNGALWIAVPRADGDEYVLRPVRDAAPAGLIGLSEDLDSALAGVTT
jgi:hypothetical protein